MREKSNLTLVVASAIVSGLLFYWLIKTQIEPWMVETICKELVKCN